MIQVCQPEVFVSLGFPVEPLESYEQESEAQVAMTRLAVIQAAQTEYIGYALSVTANLEHSYAEVPWKVARLGLFTWANLIVASLARNERPLSPAFGILRPAGNDKFVYSHGETHVYSGDQLESILADLMVRILKAKIPCSESAQFLSAMHDKVTIHPGVPTIGRLLYHLCFHCDKKRFWVDSESVYVCSCCGRETEKLFV